MQFISAQLTMLERKFCNIFTNKITNEKFNVSLATTADGMELDQTIDHFQRKGNTHNLMNFEGVVNYSDRECLND